MNLPYEDTSVSMEKSRHDIDRTLASHGIDGVQWTSWANGKAVLRFELPHGGTKHMVRLTVDPEKQGKLYKPHMDRRRSTSKLTPKERHYLKEGQRLHRTLYWYVKSKLEAVQAGLEEPAEAWLASIEGPRGHTVYQEMRKDLGAMKPGSPLTMPALPSGKR